MKKHTPALVAVLLALALLAPTALAGDYNLVMGSPHPGEVTQGSKTYPFYVTFDYWFEEDGVVTGSIQWTTLGSIHVIEGRLQGSNLYFKEVDYIQKGRAKLNCVYYMKYSPNLNVFQGTWKELGTNKGGTAVFRVRR